MINTITRTKVGVKTIARIQKDKPKTIFKLKDKAKTIVRIQKDKSKTIFKLKDKAKTIVRVKVRLRSRAQSVNKQ